MKLRSLLLVCFVLLSALPLFAQSGGIAADPISGTWTGGDGAGFELKFDGQSAVSGTVKSSQNSAPIKAGTFDPKTGTLKLEGEAKGPDGTVVQFVIEGKLDNDTLTGSYTFGNGKGNFKFTKVAAQQPGANDTAAALRYGFGEVSGWITKAADLVPADKYSYRPVSSVRTFGQQIGHIADSYNYYCARAAGRKEQWSDATEKGNTDKATLVQKLKQATDACNTVYGGNSQAGMLMSNIAHANLHYGNVITYIRMLGLVPPSS